MKKVKVSASITVGAETRTITGCIPKKQVQYIIGMVWRNALLINQKKR